MWSSRDCEERYPKLMTIGLVPCFYCGTGMTHDDILILRYCLSVFMYLFVIDFLFNHCAPVYLYQSVYATEYVHTRIIYIHNDTRTHTHTCSIHICTPTSTRVYRLLLECL